MKKISVLAIITAIGIAGSSVFSTHAANIKDLRARLEIPNCIVFGGDRHLRRK